MGHVETIFGLLVVILGLVVFYSEKGSSKHRMLGKLYILVLLGWCVLAYVHKNPVASIGSYLSFLFVGLSFMLSALYPLLLRKRIKVWVVWHYILMCYSVLFCFMSLITYLFIDDFIYFLMDQKVIESIANVIGRVVFWFIPFTVGTIWIFSKRRYYESKFRNMMMRHPKS